MSGALRAAAGVAAAVVALIFTVVLLFAGTAAEQAARQAAVACGPDPAAQPQQGPSVTVNGIPAGPVAGYAGDQLAIAAQVIKAGADQGVGVQGQTLGVAAAMGESSLTNVMHGDTVGPDSIGILQQRANGAWGSLADRTNPYIAATNFFKALKQVAGWQNLAPTVAIHQVQSNADPQYYTPFWAPAVQVVKALSGANVQLLQTSTGASPVFCTPPQAGGGPGGPPGGPVQVAPGGWTNPVPGSTLTSGFGLRGPTSVTAAQSHLGDDLAAPLGTPIRAAQAGVVIDSGPAAGFGDWIRIDHGGGVITVYGHMFPQDLLVRVGDRVTAGQQISRVGQNGQSTGPHCHFEVHLNGQPVDPAPFMAAHAAALT